MSDDEAEMAAAIAMSMEVGAPSSDVHPGLLAEPDADVPSVDLVFNFNRQQVAPGMPRRTLAARTHAVFGLTAEHGDGGRRQVSARGSNRRAGQATKDHGHDVQRTVVRIHCAELVPAVDL